MDLDAHIRAMLREAADDLDELARCERHEGQNMGPTKQRQYERIATEIESRGKELRALANLAEAEEQSSAAGDGK